MEITVCGGNNALQTQFSVYEKETIQKVAKRNQGNSVKVPLQNV